jgi:formate hydrogenlyase subunit 3/multisubunit Na+/H+ antiporter MnhD subunit
VRGGAIPVFAWGTLLFVLFVGNWIWDAKPVNAEVAAAASLIVYAWAIFLWLANRESVKTGPPEPEVETAEVPRESFAAMLIGLSIGCILFGLTWAKFLVYFGIGALVLSLGRLGRELRAERATRRRVLGLDREGRG